MKYYIHDSCPHLDKAIVTKRGGMSSKCISTSSCSSVGSSAVLDVRSVTSRGRGLLTDGLFLTVCVFDVIGFVRFKGKKSTNVTLVEFPPHVCPVFKSGNYLKPEPIRLLLPTLSPVSAAARPFGRLTGISKYLCCCCSRLLSHTCVLKEVKEGVSGEKE